jgi:hypothetical protein
MVLAMKFGEPCGFWILNGMVSSHMESKLKPF